MKGQLAGGSSRVDVLRQREQLHATLVEQNRGVDQLPERARQAVGHTASGTSSRAGPVRSSLRDFAGLISQPVAICGDERVSYWLAA